VCTARPILPYSTTASKIKATQPPLQPAFAHRLPKLSTIPTPTQSKAPRSNYSCSCSCCRCSDQCWHSNSIVPSPTKRSSTAVALYDGSSSCLLCWAGASGESSLFQVLLHQTAHSPAPPGAVAVDKLTCATSTGPAALKQHPHHVNGHTTSAHASPHACVAGRATSFLPYQARPTHTICIVAACLMPAESIVTHRLIFLLSAAVVDLLHADGGRPRCSRNAAQCALQRAAGAACSRVRCRAAGQLVQ